MKSATRSVASVCQCCGLLLPPGEMLVWRQRSLCRQLSALGPRRESDPSEGWRSGLYDYYHVVHEHAVCADCYNHLAEGGEMAGALRNRAKRGFLTLLIVIAVLIASMPVLLPALRTAFWLLPEEGAGRPAAGP